VVAIGDKSKKKTKTLVEPLDHGHLNNIAFIEIKKQTDAAIRIQSIYRTRKEIRRAELVARKQAFHEAREIALREMKEKVVKEFKAREVGTGVGKMKWDAQVRMRQAKARINGEANMSRSEMVLLMMEETIHKAEADIREKFHSLESNEAFIGVEFEKEATIKLDVVEELNVEAMFGMFFSSSQAEDPEIVVDSIATPRPDEVDAAVKNQIGKDKDNDNEDDADGEGTELQLIPMQSALSKARTQDIILGKFIPAASKIGNNNNASSKSSLQTSTLAATQEALQSRRGDTQAESEFRQLMSIAEPNTEHMFTRIRSLDKALTLIKSAGLLAELPSKRLLLKYVAHLGLKSLSHELCVHFRIVRDTDAIAKTLKVGLNIFYLTSSIP
jgi:hypothetical protein